MSDNKPTIFFEESISVGTKSNFKEDRVGSDPNSFKNYREDVFLSLAKKISEDAALLTRTLFDRITKENLPIDETLCYNAYTEVKQHFADVLSPSFFEDAHNQEDKRLKAREIGAVLREHNSPVGYIKFVILDNVPKNLQDPAVLDSLDFVFKAGCPNPYCNLSGGQYATKGKDNFYDYYCPKCKLTYHSVITKEKK
jgi:hypothetical protein